MGNLLYLLTNAQEGVTAAGVHNNDIVTGNICAGNTLFIFQIIYTVVLIIQIAVPFVLIVLGSIDFFKSVVAGDEKEMKQKRKPFVQRLIAAIIIFIIPFIVSLIITTFFKDSKFGACWNEAKSNRTINIPTTDDILNNGSGKQE